MTEAIETAVTAVRPKTAKHRWHQRRPEQNPSSAVAPVSDIETVIRFSKWVEHALAHRYGATGHGLREKRESIADQLPADVHAHLDFLGRVRNARAHDHGVDQIRNPGQYNQPRDALIAFLRPEQAPSPPLPEPLGWSVVWRLLRLIGIAPSNLGRKLRPIRRGAVALAFVAALVPFLFASESVWPSWLVIDPTLQAMLAAPVSAVSPEVHGLFGAMLALVLAALVAIMVMSLLSEPVVLCGIILLDLALVLLAFTTSAWLLWQLQLLLS